MELILDVKSNLDPILSSFTIKDTKENQPRISEPANVWHFIGRIIKFHLCLLVSWLVCNQDYTKTTEWISTKLGWRTDLGQE